MLTSEQAIPEFEGLATPIRVPPMRVRQRDLEDWIRYGLRQ